MKKFVMTGLFVSALAVSAFAGTYKGFIADAGCAAKGRAGSAGHSECSAKCIKGGAAAVLVTPDGKVYKIAEQDKVKEHAGHEVTITGDLKDDTLTVESVKME